MPRGALQNRQDCEDFIRGCLFMGTGGGGGIEWGMEMLTAALDEGLSIEWVDVSEIPDDAWTCTPYGMGSIAPPSAETLAQIERLGLVDRLGHRAMEVAVQELGRYAGVEIGAIVPSELGAGNTPAPLITGVRLGIPVVDGDYAGRAIPEEMQGMPYLYGKNSFPLASVDRWGNVVILKEACSPHMLERIGKMLAVAAFGTCTIAATLLSGREMKEIIVPGTLTRCLHLGRAIRQARERGDDPVQAAIEHTGGWLLFEGEVTGKEWEDREGYMIGTTHIKGTGRFAGHGLDVWFKNENHVSWLDGQPYVCSPDLVTIVDQETGEGFTNTVIDAGHRVAVIGIKGLEAFRSERGLAAAGPRYFGFGVDYVPIEEIVG
ncbi:MAG: DUF917 domain-containing protein [Anaerolineae bacterium]|nr:DUF917 domain-containing protein [Anaerolineae bacterium]